MSTLEEYIESNERRDGIRFSWNHWPNTRTEAAKTVVPLGCLFTPLKERPDLPPIHYNPVHCGQCQAILNPYCQSDFRNKRWSCCFCLNPNAFPPAYMGISEEQPPPELVPQYNTIDYTLQMAAHQQQAAPLRPIVFLFCVDLCMDEANLQAVKESIQLSTSIIPQQALVGLISYGKHVMLHELNCEGYSKQTVFRGTKEMTSKSLVEMLNASGGQPGSKLHSVFSKYLQPCQDCDSSLSDIIDQFVPDPWPIPEGKRPLRCSGAAFSVGISLLEAAYSGMGCRLMMFQAGPCSVGPGNVVNDELREPIRSHDDLWKDKAKYTRKATKFYENLSKRAASAGVAVDVFACFQDQTGLFEMKSLSNSTAGHLVMGDSFNTSLFRQTYQKVFGTKEGSPLLKMSFNASVEVKSVRELKVMGAIGPCVSANKKGPVSDNEIGIGGTTCWNLCTIDPSTTLGIFFEVASQQANQPTANRMGVVQFITRYTSADGMSHIRVTTTGRNFVDPKEHPEFIKGGFDQEASAVLMARVAVHKAEVDENPDVLKWLDKMLIRLCQKYGNYVASDPASFVLADNFSLYPQFMFHLRRSPFLQVYFLLIHTTVRGVAKSEQFILL